MTQASSEPTPIIAVVGSAMMDLTCYADKLPAAGETFIGQLFTTGFGGKGANQGVMARRCGAEVYMVASVGGDLFGKSIADNFANEGLNTSFLQFSNVATGVAHIWVDGTGENRIIIVPGANSDIDAAIAAKAISEIKDLKIVLAQCEINQEVTLAAFRAAKVRGCLTLLNPAPYQTLSTELLALTDWLIPNEIEFAQIHHDHSYPNGDEVIASLRKGQSAIVTLGAEGAALVDTSGKVERFGAPKVHVVDSTGAGDGFIGAFAAALALGISTELAVQFGCEVASISVTRKGAQSSYPERDEIAEIFDRIGS
jgi:ribokinase